MQPNPSVITPYQNPYQTVASDKANDFGDYPLLVVPEGKPGSAEYERKLDALFKRLHDWLSSRWLYRNDTNGTGPFARNPLKNYKRVNGTPDEADHADILAPFGQAGLSQLQAADFYSTNLGVLAGILAESPLRYSVDILNPEVSERALDKVAQMGAEGFLRAAAQQASQATGTDLQPGLTDPSIFVPDNEDEVMAPLTEKEEIASVTYDMLKAASEETRLERILANCFDDLGVVNAEMMEIRIENGKLRVDRLTGNEVAWLGPAEIEKADQADGWGIFRMLPATQCVAQYGGYMEEVDTLKAFKSWLENGMKDQPAAVAGPKAQTSWSLRNALPYVSNGDTPALLESRIYVKLVRFLKFALTLDGLELSDEQVKKFRKRQLDEAERVLYTRLTDEEAEVQKAQGRAIHTIPIVELWESVRLGGEHLIYRRPAPGQIRRQGERANVKYPIIAHFQPGQSLVTKGVPLYELHTNIMTKLRKLVALSGMKTLVIDASEVPEGSSVDQMLIEANEIGVLVINSQRTSGAPTKESYKHMTTVDLSLNDNVVHLLNLAATLRDMYDNMTGVTPAMKGLFANREALGQTQMAKLQGTLISQRHFAAHSEFVREGLEVMVNLGKYVWAGQGRKRILLGEGGVKTLRLAEEINSYDYGIYLSDSMKAARDKEFLMNVAQQGMSSGQVGLREIISMYYADNPYKVLSIVRDGLSAYERMEGQIKQMQAENQQAMAEAAKARAQAPIEVANITGQWKLEVEKLKQEFEAMRQEGKLQHDADKFDVGNQVAVKRDAMRLTAQEEMANPQPEVVPVDAR
ncbi:hypothetical protein [Spirosoma sordidisoli]|uniref:Portal protein n=1 Tax=Spirosoma sordidisoli TaxID=2502893 RepID=A0A4Q2UJH8_9BACT|nr:hypothetical protein [Spirosoma sordidisoli]RYC69643.1 hypothetical protein EQG79_13665 [Spirosoma sordidisoli]